MPVRVIVCGKFENFIYFLIFTLYLQVNNTRADLECRALHNGRGEFFMPIFEL
jgi:hypothetical protein